MSIKAVQKNMNSKNQNSPFKFLFNTINVLIVDDDKNVMDFYKKALGKYPYYNITGATNAIDAEIYLNSSQYINICLMDLGIRDKNDDEFYLLKKYSNKTVFIVVSGSDSLELGCVSRALGARGAVHKTDFRKMHLIEKINAKFLESFYLPPMVEDWIPKNKTESLFTSDIFETFEDSLEKTGFYHKNISKKSESDTCAFTKIICSFFDMYRTAFEYEKQGGSVLLDTTQLCNWQKIYGENFEVLHDYFIGNMDKSLKECVENP